MQTRTFDLDGPDPEREPASFNVRGTRATTGEPFEATFGTVSELPPAVIDDLSVSVIINEKGEAFYQRHEVLRLLRAAITPADRERWDELVRDPDRLVRLDRLVEIMHWIVGALTERPTGPLSSSQAGSAETGNGSEAASSQQATPEPASTDSG